MQCYYAKKRSQASDQARQCSRTHERLKEVNKHIIVSKMQRDIEYCQLGPNYRNTE